jgi:hypothetical protein
MLAAVISGTERVLGTPEAPGFVVPVKKRTVTSMFVDVFESETS